MFTRVSITIIVVLVSLSALGAIKGLQIRQMMAHGKDFVPPPQTVTVALVNRSDWETSIRAVGSLQAVKGVMLTAELSGKITRIVFESGSQVAAGQMLLQQDISTEIAQLQVAESEADLALREFVRARKLFSKNVIQKSRFDERKAIRDQTIAQVKLIRTTIAKKTIRAPFSGRLGIRQVNLGEVLDSGQPIVSLQSLNPIYVNFQLPQHHLKNLSPGYVVRVGSDILGSDRVEGSISALNPEVDSTTRNIAIQATLPNTDERLRPGMFVTVAVVLPSKKSVLTIPATAVHYAPYSDSVFLVVAKGESSDSQSLVLRQQFVRLGEKRGDFVVVREGLTAGQSIVSTGVFKLRNGQAVAIDNSQAPVFKTAPRPVDS
ncbi:MAG: efflux RND transporter periplasmic adaptor subunit [Desulfobacterales bacterium]|nr:efflux RND transporter periplasmic adaptor subunit [Desulfobacterales bacterium]